VPGALKILEFVNADEIARGLSPFNADAAAISAGRLMLQRMRDLVAAEQSFAFETTCSGRGYGPWLRERQSDGWQVTLLFFWLPNPEAALARVARRVASGGHGIPVDVVIRRYWAGLRNLRHMYLPLADVAAIYDNSDSGRVLLAEKESRAQLEIRDPARWESMWRSASVTSITARDS
jgi:predicted ABC-type ATPase